jgi:sulfur-oxidizing protein SoxY
MTHGLTWLPSRRRFLIGTAGAGLVATLLPRTGRATPEEMQEALHKIIGEATVREGKVTLDLPPLVENGNTVPLTVTVESPMSESDYVRAIHVLNQKNPQPYVITAHLGPRAGRARISTRIKLADAQTVLAVAEMSDGSFWSGSADIVVTIAACVEDVP